MKQTLIAKGAEALIYKIKNKVIKDRIPKPYRHPELDKKLIKRRTKSEAKLLEKASKIINAPKPLEDPGSGRMIHMPYIPGKKLSEHLDTLPNAIDVCETIGINLAKLHDADIIHGDLTTSNMILSNKNDENQDKNNTKPLNTEKDLLINTLSDSSSKLFFIDFGLGFTSSRIEDKAVDLHLIKQALEAKHFKNHKEFFQAILKGYKLSKNSSLVLNQLKKVELRGRYKQQF